MVLFHNYFVYIMTNKFKNVLYIGVTNNLRKRVFEHQSGKLDGFSKKYNCHFLVYYEHFTNINHAFSREKELKKWRREKKDNLIFSFNQDWKFLNNDIEAI